MEVRKGEKEYFNKRYIKERPQYFYIWRYIRRWGIWKYENVFPTPPMMKEEITLKINKESEESWDAASDIHKELKD